MVLLLSKRSARDLNGYVEKKRTPFIDFILFQFDQVDQTRHLTVASQCFDAVDIVQSDFTTAGVEIPNQCFEALGIELAEETSMEFEGERQRTFALRKGMCSLPCQRCSNASRKNVERAARTHRCKRKVRSSTTKVTSL